MRLLAIVLLVLAALLAVLALLVGAAMVADPGLIQPGFVALLLLAALAGACAVVGRRLRAETAEAAAWGDWDRPEEDGEM